MTKAKSKELTSKDPEFLPVQFDATEARLSQLAQVFNPELIPEANEKGDEAYLEIHKKVMEMTGVRSDAEKVRKALKADALKWGREVDAYAKELMIKLITLEKPWREIKVKLDEKEVREAQERIEAEQERVRGIEEAIKFISAHADDMHGMSAHDINSRLGMARAIKVEESRFGEFVEPAQIAKDTVIAKIEAALDRQLAFEDNEAGLEEKRLAMEAENAELKKKLEESEKAQQALRASQEAVEAAEKEEAQRKAAVKEELERKAAAAEAAKKDAASLKKRLPQDKEARAFAERLLIATISKPDLDDSFLAGMLTDVVCDVLACVNLINEKTQGGK